MALASSVAPATPRVGVDSHPWVRFGVRRVGRLLESHVRLEERELFPLIERLVDELSQLEASRRDEPELRLD